MFSPLCGHETTTGAAVGGGLLSSRSSFHLKYLRERASHSTHAVTSTTITPAPTARVPDPTRRKGLSAAQHNALWRKCPGRPSLKSNISTISSSQALLLGWNHTASRVGCVTVSRKLQPPTGLTTPHACSAIAL